MIKRQTKLSIFLIITAALLIASTPCHGDNYLPHNLKGIRESGYALSEYENVNLANGNLTFQVPLYTLYTDGGLEYPIKAYFNAKLWYSKSICMGLVPNSEECEQWNYGNWADGIENFGFGWDLRPPRITFLEQEVPAFRGGVYVDASGASHELYSAAPWEEQPSARVNLMSEYADVGSHIFTGDGTNFQLTVKATEPYQLSSHLPNSVRLEDGHGNVYVFNHIVPFDCNKPVRSPVSCEDQYDPDVYPDEYAACLAAPNFNTRKAGLYLSEIQRGPWSSSGVPENRIVFSYRSTASDLTSSQCIDQWLISEIKAVSDGALQVPGTVERKAVFNYTTFEGITVLSNIEVPGFNPLVDDESAGTPTQIGFGYGSDLVSYSYSELLGQGVTFDFEAPCLREIDFGNNDEVVFEFEPLPELGKFPLSRVTLPTGAEIQYGYAIRPVDNIWPVGYVYQDQYLTEGGPGDVFYCGHHLGGVSESRFADGLLERKITYFDVATENGSPRIETTRFGQNLNCEAAGGFSTSPTAQWPYDFHYALRELDADSRDHNQNDYLWTYVITSNGETGSLDTDSVSAEIHRFHPHTREEFSIDYVTGTPETIDTYVNALYDDITYIHGFERFVNEFGTVRRLRHVEIQQSPKDESVDNYFWTTEGETRYTHVKERRVYTDGSNTADVADVGSCYPPVTPGALTDDTQPTTAHTCAEVRISRTVDDYQNPLSVTTESFNTNPTHQGLEIEKTITNQYAYSSGGESVDTEYFWMLGLKTSELVSDGTDSTRTTYFWEDLSDTGAGVQRFFVPKIETKNPSEISDLEQNIEENVICTDDCLKSTFGYDGLGNQSSVLLEGGYGVPAEDADSFEVVTEFLHGRQVGRYQIGGTYDLVLFERKVDPYSGLFKWHLDGAGIGYAYGYNNLGRLTDVVPIKRVSDQAESGNTWLAIDALAGARLSRTYPPSSSLLRHDLYDAYYDQIALAPQIPNPTGTELRETYRFDGLGRLNQEIEQYPNGQRTRFHLSLIHDDDSTETCQAIHPWDIDLKSQVKLDSEWIEWPTDAVFPSDCSTLPWSQNPIPWNESQMDTLGRPALVRVPDDNRISTEYFGDFVSTVTRNVASEIGVNTIVEHPFTTTTVKDPFGRVRRVEEQRTNSDFVVSSYDYDQSDRLTNVSIAEPDGQTRTFAYSTGGFLTSSIEPEKTTIFPEYDAYGNALKSISNGVTSTFVYDDFGRPESTTVNGIITSNVEYGDDGTTDFNRGYNKVVTTSQHNRYDNDASEVVVSTAWIYDGPGGRVSEKRLKIDDLGALDEDFEVSYEYDEWGNASYIGYPRFAGCRVSPWGGVGYEYDGSWLTNMYLKSTSATQELAGFSYLPSGRTGTTTYDNGFASLVETAANGMARPDTINLYFADDPDHPYPIGDYLYDGSGNIRQDGDPNTTGYLKTYTYDGLNRLNTYDFTDGSIPKSQSFAYDDFGNLTTLVQNYNQTPHSTIAFGVDSHNRLTTVAGSALGWYRGNLTNIPALDGSHQKQFTYSGEDRLMESVDGASSTAVKMRYAYDAAGERVLRWWMSSGSPEAQVYVRDEAGRMLSEWLYRPNQFDVYRDHFFGAIGQLAQINYDVSPAPVYMAADHLGSTRVVFNKDPNTFEELDYYPFGHFLTDTTDPQTDLLFTGHERDDGEISSELDYMHARYYSPVLARFVSVDPLGGEIGSSQSWNRYSYVLNNPIAFVDPTGEAHLDPSSTEEEIIWVGDAEDEVLVTADDPNNGIDRDMLRIAGGGATENEVPWNPAPALEFSISSPSLYLPDVVGGKGIPFVFDATASIDTKGLQAGISVSPGLSLGLQTSALFTGTVTLQPPSGGATTSVDLRGGGILGLGLAGSYDSGGVTTIKGMVGYGAGGRIKMNHSTTIPVIGVSRDFGATSATAEWW